MHGMKRESKKRQLLIQKKKRRVRTSYTPYETYKSSLESEITPDPFGFIMIRKTQITFDAHSQKVGSTEVRFIGEELLTEKGPIQIINSFFGRLPFRLRLGSRSVFEIKGLVPARIAVINSVDIPNVDVQKKLLGHPPHPAPVPPEFASDVLITLKPVTLKEDMKTAIAGALQHSDFTKATAKLHVLDVLEDLLKPLNTLVVSYWVLFGQEVEWNRVRRVLRKDISAGQTFNLHVFKRQHDSDDFQKIEDSIADATPASPIPFTLGGNMHDISAENIAKLQHKLSYETQYAYYSMALQAEAHIQQTDYLNALLYSVIAFENAHAELLEYVAETKAGDEKARKWVQNLLRQAGISTMVRLTPYLFMDPENRPSDTTVEKVARAIEIRNQLVHAKRDKKRNLKFESHVSDDLLPLIREVFTYINTIARQLPD